MTRKAAPGKATDPACHAALRKVRPPIGDLAALVSGALDAPATIVEDGRRRRGTKRALIAAQLVDRSTRADLRATKLLLDLLRTIAPRALGTEGEPEPVDAGGDDVITSLLARLGLAE